jgi:exopolyphosphatase/guanosine-5'-triphosphate,3'-diphosphate pyrophosphatase
MLFAAIDIGSNAVRLYFANVFFPKELPVVEKASLIRLPLRLGEDVFTTGKISEERILKLLETLKAFKILIDVYNPLDYIACATSAMREAKNRVEIVKRIYSGTGIDVKIIGGIEEARIVCAANNIITSREYELSMYVDVGGGSTEISILRNHELIATNSFKIGTLRILSGADHTEEWERLQLWLMNFENNFGNIYLIGSGGNINKLCKLYSQKGSNKLTLEEMEKGYRQLKSKTLKQRIEEMGLRPDRADVIVPAVEIFLLIMKTIRSENIYVPRIGLSDGLIYTVYNKFIQKDISRNIKKK